jgi:GNAT superfamily N-acetyltransferase
MTVTVRPAALDEVADLTELIMRSKAYWGYDEEFIARCRPALTLHPADVGPKRATVAEIDGRLAGVVTIGGTPPEGEIDLLFVDPWAIGTGVGRLLYHCALAIGRDSGFEALLIEADPQAESFYLHMGAVRIGDTVSPATGRTLPLLRAATA